MMGKPYTCWSGRVPRAGDVEGAWGEAAEKIVSLGGGVEYGSCGTAIACTTTAALQRELPHSDI
jgi:hypothetical protein